MVDQRAAGIGEYMLLPFCPPEADFVQCEHKKVL